MTDGPKKTRSKAFYVFLVVLFAVIGIGMLGWNLYKYHFIKSKVKDSVYEKSNGLYTIRYDDMRLDEVGGYLHVSNLEVIPDTARYREMVRKKSNPGLLLQLKVPELTVAGVKTPEAALSKKISGRKLEVNNAEVVFYYAKAHPDTSKDAVKGELYQQVLGSLKEIQADSIELTHINVSFIDIRTNRKTIEASDISVHLRDILIDSTSGDDKSRFFFAKSVQVTAGKGIVKNKDNTYFYIFNGISFSNDANTFSANLLEVAPQLSEERYAAYSRIQKDRFNFAIKHLSLKGINLERLTDGDVIADELTIADADFKIYRDLSYPRDTKSRVGSYPQQLLMELPIILSLKKMIVRNAFIEYKEKNPKSDYSGRVQFEQSSAVITNITDDPSLIKRNNHCQIDFTSRFLGMAPMKAHLDLLLNQPQGRFSYKGSMDGFDATNLNVLMRPMGLAQVEKGRVNKVDFDFTGHNFGADGKVTILYDDLKISLLKKDSAENKLSKKKLASALANMFVKNSNPSGNKPARVGDVHYERDTNRSFFNLMWKSIYTGIKKSAGM